MGTVSMFEDIRDRYLEGIAAMGIELPSPQVELNDCPGPVAKAADRFARASQHYAVVLSKQSDISEEINQFQESHQIRTVHELEEYSQLSSRFCEVTQELLASIPEYEAAAIELARLQGRLRNDT